MADALSAYAVCADGTATYAELVERALTDGRAKLGGDFKLIPTFTVGWDPTPRIERPTPWTTKADGTTGYRGEIFAKRASGAELLQGAKTFADFIKREVKGSFVGHVLTFAWNEFEEGGFFCPTYTENGDVDATRVKIFAEIAELWRGELGEI